MGKSNGRNGGSLCRFAGSPNVQLNASFRIPSRNARLWTISARGCDLAGYCANTNPAPTAKLVSRADERAAISTMQRLLYFCTLTTSLAVGCWRALPQLSRVTDRAHPAMWLKTRRPPQRVASTEFLAPSTLAVQIFGLDFRVQILNLRL